MISAVHPGQATFTTSKFCRGCYWLNLYRSLYTSSEELSNTSGNSPSLLVQAKAPIFQPEQLSSCTCSIMLTLTEQLGNTLGLQAYQSLCTCPQSLSVFSRTDSKGERIREKEVLTKLQKLANSQKTCKVTSCVFVFFCNLKLT